MTDQELIGQMRLIIERAQEEQILDMNGPRGIFECLMQAADALERQQAEDRSPWMVGTSAKLCAFRPNESLDIGCTLHEGHKGPHNCSFTSPDVRCQWQKCEHEPICGEKHDDWRHHCYVAEKHKTDEYGCHPYTPPKV